MVTKHESYAGFPEEFRLNREAGLDFLALGCRRSARKLRDCLTCVLAAGLALTASSACSRLTPRWEPAGGCCTCRTLGAIRAHFQVTGIANQSSAISSYPNPAHRMLCPAVSPQAPFHPRQWKALFLSGFRSELLRCIQDSLCMEMAKHEAQKGGATLGMIDVLLVEA